MINGLDILVLLKMVANRDVEVPSKTLADQLSLQPSEITRSLQRTRTAGLSYVLDRKPRVNRAALLEFLAHGLRFVFPAQKGSITRGIPTGFAAEPLKSHFIDTTTEAPVWPYAHGQMRGPSIKPLHRQAPKAALEDEKLYELLALVDGVRGDKIRERAIAGEELAVRLA